MVAQVQEKFDGFISFLTISTFPTILYMVTHWDVIFESEHFWSIGLLSSIPILYVCFIQSNLLFHICMVFFSFKKMYKYLIFMIDGLWWISTSIATTSSTGTSSHQDENVKVIVRLTLMIIYGIVFIAAFEGRIIFHSFGSYITLTWPWNWIFVSLMLYINFAIFIAHLTGIYILIK